MQHDPNARTQITEVDLPAELTEPLPSDASTVTVAARTAAVTTLGVHGVHHLGTLLARAADRVRSQLGRSAGTAGVQVDQAETSLDVVVSIVVTYPENVVEVADEVRRQVTEAVSQLSDLPVTVDVRVFDVHGPFDDEPTPLDRVRDAASDAADRVKEGADRVHEGAADAAERARDAASDAVDRARDAAGTARDAVADATDRARDAVGDAAEQTADRVRAAADEAADRGHDLADRARAGAADAADRARDGASRARDAAAEAVSHAGDAAGSARDAAASAGAEVADRAARAADDASDSAREAGAAAEDAARDTEHADRAADAASTATDGAPDASALDHSADHDDVSPADAETVAEALDEVSDTLERAARSLRDDRDHQDRP